MRKQLVTYSAVLVVLQILLCRANQMLNIEFVRFIENNLGPQSTWPDLTRWVLLHPGFPYLIPLALCGFLVVGITKKNDTILTHGIGLNATGFCFYLLVHVFANLLPFAGTLIGRIE